MKMKPIPILLLVVTLAAMNANAWPPGGFGPGWNFNKIPGGQAWRGPIGNGVFAGVVQLTFDANGDGKVTVHDKSRSFVHQKVQTPGIPLLGKGLEPVMFEAEAIQPAPSPNATRSPTFNDHKTVVTLEIQGLNLMNRSGKFESFEDEHEKCGRILIWLDSRRETLLLDSGDYRQRQVEWLLAEGPVPQALYVEAITPGQAGGTFRLTATIDDSNQSALKDKLFGLRPGHDHLLMSAAP